MKGAVAALLMTPALAGAGSAALAQSVVQPFQGVPTSIGVVTMGCAPDGKRGYVYSVNGAAAISHGSCKAGTIPEIQRSGSARELALFNGKGFTDAYFAEPAPTGAPGRIAIRFRTSGPPILLDYGGLDAAPEIVYITDDIVELRVPPKGQAPGTAWQCAVQFDWSLARIVAVRPTTTGPLRMSAADCADRFKTVAARYDG